MFTGRSTGVSPVNHGQDAHATLEDLLRFLTGYINQDEDISAFTGPGDVNTDDNSLIEFQAPKDLHTNTQWSLSRTINDISKNPIEILDTALWDEETLAAQTLLLKKRRQSCSFFYEGLIALVKRDAKQAIPSFYKTLLLDPGNLKAHMMYRQTLRWQISVKGNTNNWADLLVPLTQYLELYPHETEMSDAILQLCSRHNRKEKAVTIFTELVAKYPGSPDFVRARKKAINLAKND